MKDNIFYLVPSYRGRTDIYLIIHRNDKYELWQNEFGDQPKIYLGEPNQMLIALAQKANLPQ